MSLLCLWCDDPLPGPIAYRLCSTCAPYGDTSYTCTAGKGHLPTYSSISCGECDEDERRRLRIEAENAPKLAALRKMRKDLIEKDWHKPWRGMEFAKAIVGRMIDGEIRELGGDPNG